MSCKLFVNCKNQTLPCYDFTSPTIFFDKITHVSHGSMTIKVGGEYLPYTVKVPSVGFDTIGLKRALANLQTDTDEPEDLCNRVRLLCKISGIIITIGQESYDVDEVSSIVSRSKHFNTMDAMHTLYTSDSNGDVIYCNLKLPYNIIVKKDFTGKNPPEKIKLIITKLCCLSRKTDERENIVQRVKTLCAIESTDYPFFLCNKVEKFGVLISFGDGDVRDIDKTIIK